VDPFAVFLAPGGFAREVEALGIRTAEVHTGRVRNAARAALACAQLRAVIARERPDALIGFGAKAQVYLGPAAAAAGAAARSAWWQNELPARAVHRLATTLPAAAIGCPSQYLADAQGRWRPRRRMFVIRPGIDPPEPPPAADVAALRERLGIPPGAPVIGMVGRLSPVKRHDLLLHALADLRRRGVPAHALILGTDSHALAPRYARGIPALARELGLADAVTFTGHVDDVPAHLAVMDVFVSAAAREGFGIAVLEAMGQGVPVVAVDAGGTRESVVPGETGLAVPPDDAAAIAGAVARLIADPALRHRLGERARAVVRERFTTARMLAEFHERLEELARGDGR
jgi:glycosyltransferase involved in cell wall biosynthesis